MNKQSGFNKKDTDFFSIVNNAFNDIFTKENTVESEFSHVYHLLSK